MDLHALPFFRLESHFHIPFSLIFLLPLMSLEQIKMQYWSIFVPKMYINAGISAEASIFFLPAETNYLRWCSGRFDLIFLLLPSRSFYFAASCIVFWFLSFPSFTISVLIDIRAKDVYKRGYISGSINILSACWNKLLEMMFWQIRSDFSFTSISLILFRSILYCFLISFFSIIYHFCTISLEAMIMNRKRQQKN